MNFDITEIINFERIFSLEGYGETLDTLKEYIERIDEEVKIPRATRTLISDSIAEIMKKYISENRLEEGCCYYVKNIGNNICFVHVYSSTGKSFKNLDLAMLPSDIKNGDVIVMKDGKYVVEQSVTDEIYLTEKRIIDSLKNSIELFRKEGTEYFVCGKSDDSKNPKMNLRIEDTNQEFWGIEIGEELYNKIKFGSKVKYESGKYIFVS